MNKNRLLQKEECVIRNSFWNRYIDLVKNMVIPYQWDILNDRREDAEPSHAIDNLRIAGGKMKGHFYGQVFQDSDVYKWLEAVGNILMLERDPELEEKADAVIDLIAEAQEEDGYLDTYFSIEEPDKKWTNVLECHELYCAGHFIESAVSYYRATGKEKILQIAYKLADYLDRVFGPEEGKLHGYPGHQEIEIALLKLYDLSGNEKYLNLAGYFINTRGTNHFFEEEFEKRDHVSFWEKARTRNQTGIIISIRIIITISSRVRYVCRKRQWDMQYALCICILLWQIWPERQEIKNCLQPAGQSGIIL